MDKVESTLRALEQARRRKTELKTLLGALYHEYKLIKTEIKLHEERLERWMSEREYAEYLDTIKIDDSLEFAAFSDQGPTQKK